MADLRSLPRADVAAAVRSLVAQALGSRCPHGVVLAWVALVLAVLYSDTGTTRRGLAELAARAGVSRQTITAYRKRMMPPEGEPSRWGLLVRPFRGRAGHGVSRWAVGDQLLHQIQARIRDQRARSRRSALRQDSAHVAPPSTGPGPAGAAEQPPTATTEGPSGRSAATTSDWEAFRDQLEARKRLRR